MSEEHPLLKKIRICNFKSLRDVTIELGKFNVLIGPNACGKTNIIQAFELLRDIMDPAVINPFAKFWGYSNVVWIRNEQLNIRFELEFTDGSSYSMDVTGVGGRCNILRETLKCGDISMWREGQSLKIMRNGHVEAELKHLSLRYPAVTLTPSQAVILSSIEVEKELSQEKMKEFMKKLVETLYEVIETAPVPVLSYLLRIQALRFSPSKAKEPSPPTRIMRLASDCSNLHAVLYTLFFERGSLPERFYELIGEVFPGVEELRLEPTGDGRIHLLVKERGAYMLPTNMSDGFYKFLSILTALELKPSLLAIDEIENSIHHETMEILINELKNADCQVLITTHSPVVLDLCDPEDVLLVYRGPDGTMVRRIPEPEELKHKMRELGLTLGESWVYGALVERP